MQQCLQLIPKSIWGVSAIICQTISGSPPVNILNCGDKMQGNRRTVNGKDLCFVCLLLLLHCEKMRNSFGITRNMKLCCLTPIWVDLGWLCWNIIPVAIFKKTLRALNVQ